MTNSTPQSKALNTASASAPINWNALQMNPQSHTQPLKNQTIIHPDGTKVTHTYDTEAKPVKPAKPAEPPTFPGILGSLTQTSQQGSPTTQGLIQQTAQASTPNQTQTGLIKSVQDSGQGNLAIGQKAADIASQYGKAISDVGGMGARAEAGQLTTGTSPVAEGNAAVTAQSASAQQAALAAGETAALQGTGQQLTAQQQNTGALTEALGGANTQQGQQISGLGTAAGAANTAQGQAISGLTAAAGAAKPETVPYNTQYVSPVTGQQVGGGNAGQLPADAQSAVQSYAQQVKNGQMTREDAESRLSAYGVPGTNALNAALGDNFNTNASNASAATTAIGQQIQAAIAPANQALDSLQSAFNNLSGLQQGNVMGHSVPFLAHLAQNASMLAGPGRESASQFQGALQEARSRIDAALVGSIGVNAAAAQASALLPDNMVASEIPGKIAAAKQYLQNQLASYTQSGQQPASQPSGQSSGGASSSLFSW